MNYGPLGRTGAVLAGMKNFVLAALVLVLVTGCSSRDEDAYMREVKRNASPHQWQTHSRADFIMTGDIACGMMKDGKGLPRRTYSEVTGVAWIHVWYAADDHLC